MFCAECVGWFWNLEFSRGGSLEGKGKCVSWEVLNVEGIWKGVGVIGMINVRNGSYPGMF